jgi:hypothetical protein
MKRIICIACMLLQIGIAHAQNMVPNASFETYSACPTAYSQTNRASPWYQYTDGTTDYHHTCGSANVIVPNNFFGYQIPASGNAYMGAYSFTSIITPNSYCEYLAAPITPLVKGVTYEVAMSVSLANTSRYANNGLGVWFFDSAPTTVATLTTLSVKPQVNYINYGVITDTANWVRLKAQFVADSAYDNIVIGMFIPDIASGGLQTTDLGGSSGYSYYFIDSVVVQLPPGSGVDNAQKNTSCKVYPNPVNNEFVVEHIQPGTVIKLFDLLGRVVAQQTATVTKVTIDTQTLVAGNYILQLKDENTITNIRIVKE